MHSVSTGVVDTDLVEFGLLFAHGGHVLVLEQDLVHELVPVDLPVGVGVDAHVEFVQFLFGHILAQHVPKGFHELVLGETAPLVRVCFVECHF